VRDLFEEHSYRENERTGKEQSATRFWNISPLYSTNFTKIKGKGPDPIYQSLSQPAIRSGRQAENTGRRLRIRISLMRLC
jgi:hypothetical protein